jgi:hypothetical protein
MHEIVPGLHHWTTRRDTIGLPVSSYWVEGAGLLIDPMVPEEGPDAFRQAQVGPQQIVLTTGLHDRHAARLADELGIPIRAPREAAERLGETLAFEAYGDGDELTPGAQAVRIGVLAPDEYALHLTTDVADGGAIALADTLHHYGDALSFFADGLLGEDPKAVKRGLRQQLTTLLERDWQHLLFTHGDPILDRGKRVLRDFVERPVEQEDHGHVV